MSSFEGKETYFLSFEFWKYAFLETRCTTAIKEMLGQFKRIFR